MPAKETMIPVSKILSLENEKSLNRNYIDIIIKEEIPVLCVNYETEKKRLMPFKVLFNNHDFFWQQSGSWKYFFSQENINKVKEIAAEKQRILDIENIKKHAGKTGEEEELEELEADVGFGDEHNAYVEMTFEERVEAINSNKKRLNDLLSLKVKDKEAVTKALVDTTKNAALINHAAIENAIHLADDEAKRMTQSLVDSTNELVKTSAQLISENIFSNELMHDLVEKSNGTIVQHMTRVYLSGIAFLSYYNNTVLSSSIIQKLRINFASRYRKFYHQLLPHKNIDDITLEQVFYGGMRAVPPESYFKWAVGFLIHDIGKAAAVEYHEGEGAYERRTVIEHVKLGYKNIITKTNYPMEASLITGYHHEYYGDPNGYGYFRSYLNQYKKANPNAKQDYCISYDLEPMIDCMALGYFPAKVLEIIDVYDSVTDPHRTYRKAVTPDEALAMMREEFVNKHPKIDAVIFDIYSMFIKEMTKA